MTTYIKQLIAEMKRVDGIYKETYSTPLTFKFYNVTCRSEFNKNKFGEHNLKFNEIKKLAGLEVSRVRVSRVRKKPITHTKETRICNVCDVVFPKFEDMYSCPRCTKAKSCMTAGMDDFEFGID